MKRSHGQVISAAGMGGGLRCKVIRRIKGVASVKALLILTVTMLHLSVMARRICTDHLMPAAKLRSFFQTGSADRACRRKSDW